MSVIRVSERLSPGGEHQGLLKWQDSRVLLIQTDNVNDDATYILGTGSVPGYYAAHPRNARLTARKISLRRQQELSLWWEATIEYSSEPLTSREIELARKAENDSDPLDVAAKITLESHTVKKFSSKGWLADDAGAFDETQDPTTITNSAQEPFEPSADHELDYSRWIVLVEKNVVEWPSWLSEYENTINNADLIIRSRTLAAGTVKLDQMRISDQKYESNYTYYTLSYRLVYDRDGWDQDWIDRGFNEIKSVTRQDGSSYYRLEPIFVNGSRPQQPQLLNGYGRSLSVDPTLPTDQTVYRRYRRYPSKDFSILPLS